MISRPRLAPSESRTAISFCRTAARASNRFATFAHAISSTSADDRHQQAAGLHDVVAEARVDRRLSERHERDAAPLIVVRIFLRELTRDRLQVRFRLLHA